MIPQSEIQGFRCTTQSKHWFISMSQIKQYVWAVWAMEVHWYECTHVQLYTAVHQSSSSMVDKLRRDFIGCLWLVCVIVGSLWCNDEAGGLISHTAEWTTIRNLHSLSQTSLSNYWVNSMLWNLEINKSLLRCDMKLQLSVFPGWRKR